MVHGLCGLGYSVPQIRKNESSHVAESQRGPYEA